MKIKNKYFRNFIVNFISFLLSLNLIGFLIFILEIFDKRTVDVGVFFGKVFIISIISPVIIFIVEIVFDIVSFIYRKILRNIK